MSETSVESTIGPSAVVTKYEWCAGVCGPQRKAGLCMMVMECRQLCGAVLIVVSFIEKGEPFPGRLLLLTPLIMVCAELHGTDWEL